MSKSDEQIEAQDRKRAARGKSLLPDTRSRVSQETIDYANIQGDSLKRLVCSVGTRQGAVRYGYTRDGSAFSVGLYMGDDSKTYYANTEQEMVDLMEYLNATFEK